LYGPAIIWGNYIHDNAGAAITHVNDSGGYTIRDNWLVGNAYGFLGYANSTRTATIVLERNVIADNTTQGVYLYQTTGAVTLTMTGNVFYGNGGYNFSFQGNQTFMDMNAIFADYNFMSAGSSGNYFGLSQGAHDVSGIGNPFVDNSGANRDYRLNNTAGAGALLRQGVCFPTTLNGLTNYADAGPLQAADPVIVTPSSGSIYSGKVVTSDGVVLVTGGLHASNIATAAGSGSNLTPGVLQFGTVIDDVTGTVVGGTSGTGTLTGILGQSASLTGTLSTSRGGR
jgi:hypothetical protein